MISSTERALVEKAVFRNDTVGGRVIAFCPRFVILNMISGNESDTKYLWLGNRSSAGASSQ